MPEIKFDPFLEEEAFTADSLNDRFNDVADGINAVVADGIADGALTSIHLKGGVVLVDTIEIPYANPATGFYFCDRTGVPPGTGTCYYNGAGGNWDSQLNDGDWTPIVDDTGQELKISFNPIQLNSPTYALTEGIEGILVMLNVEVGFIGAVMEDPQNPGQFITSDVKEVGVAIALQGQSIGPVFEWNHIKTSTGANTNLRTSRTISVGGPRNVGTTSGDLGGQWIWADVPIRTLITGDDISSWTGNAILGVRGVISIILTDINIRGNVKLRNANLSVFLLRSVLD